MKSIINKLQEKKNLTADEMTEVMQAIMSGRALAEDIRSFLLALRTKGATIEEITAAAKIMREFVVKVPTNHGVILDTCGTGGDKMGTFNISTIAALVVAGAGVKVAKHGNRSVSSRCGSADILEALGVNMNMPVERLSECLDKVGIAFLFAQRLHPAMKNVAPIRKDLGVETIFNVLGPLTNPALATHQMMGIYDKTLVEPMAHVLKNLGLKKALVVHGSDGLDEVTTTGKSFISEFDGQSVRSYTVTPQELGIKTAALEDLKGGDLKVNLNIARDVLNGVEGPKTDIVLLNAGCALYISEKAKTIAEGMALARASLNTGKAREKLKMLQEFSKNVG